MARLLLSDGKGAEYDITVEGEFFSHLVWYGVRYDVCVVVAAPM